MAITLTTEFKERVIKAVQEQRTRYDGPDSAFAKTLGISPSIFSRLNKG